VGDNAFADKAIGFVERQERSAPPRVIPIPGGGSRAESDRHCISAKSAERREQDSYDSRLPTIKIKSKVRNRRLASLRAALLPPLLPGSPMRKRRILRRAISDSDASSEQGARHAK
jgi:hypothetical protein